MQEDNPLKQGHQLSTINEEPKEVKKAIITVGKMGHGKSSFCKMLASMEDKDRIIAKTEPNSVTFKSQLFKIDKFQQIIEGDMYILDTPGLDSNSALSLIIEDIDDFILRQKLQIIGIAYVLSIHEGREQNGKGESFVFRFLQKLRLRYECKTDIAFCILTKFDEYYLTTKKNTKMLNQLKNQFQKKGFGKVWQRRIQWISEPCEIEQHFQQLIKTSCKEIYNQQFSKLKDILSCINKQKKYLPFDKYYQDRMQYERFLDLQFKRHLHSFKYIGKLQIPFTFDLQPDEKAGYKIAVGVTGWTGLSGLSVAGSIGLISIAIQSTGIALTIGATAGAVLLPVAAIIGGYKVMCKISSLLKNTFKKKQEEIPVFQQMKDQQFFQSQYQKRIQIKVEVSLLRILADTIAINSDTLIVKKQKFYSDLKAENKQAKKNLLTRILDFFSESNQNTKNMLKITNENKFYQIPLLIGKNVITFTINCPASEQYEKFIQKFSFPKFHPHQNN